MENGDFHIYAMPTALDNIFTASEATQAHENSTSDDDTDDDYEPPTGITNTPLNTTIISTIDELPSDFN